MIIDRVRSECLRVWHYYIPECVARVNYILMHTFSGDMCNILAWVLLCIVYHHRYPTPHLTDKRKWIPTLFCYVVNCIFNLFCLIGYLQGVLKLWKIILLLFQNQSLISVWQFLQHFVAVYHSALLQSLKQTK